MPGEQLGEPGSRVVGDAAQYVGEPGLRIDVVEFRCADESVDSRGALATAIGTGEQPRLAADCDAPQRSLGRVVGQADAPVIEEAR